LFFGRPGIFAQLRSFAHQPTRSLTDSQRQRFGRFDGPPVPEDCVRCFVLDPRALQTLGQLRGAHNRLGYPTLLCSVRFVGAFPDVNATLPPDILSVLRAQLDREDTVDLEGYWGSRTHARHGRAIREQYGFVHFSAAPQVRFVCPAGSVRRAGRAMNAPGPWCGQRRIG